MTDVESLDEDYVVQVRAQVMTRDESTGGWVPMGGGGLSCVRLRKMLSSNEDELDVEDITRPEYWIYGQKITDNSVVLDCVLKKDLQYTQANPTFHHWRTDDKRYGLTFERSADAKAFDRGIKKAVADLVDGSLNCSFSAPYLEVGDDDVIVTLDLPLGRKGSSSQSASTTSTTTSSPSPQSPVHVLPGLNEAFNAQFTHPHANHHHLHKVHYLSKLPKHHQQHQLQHQPVYAPSPLPHYGVPLQHPAHCYSSPPGSTTLHQLISPSSPPHSDSTLDTSSTGKEEVWVRSDDPSVINGKSDQGLLDSDNIQIQKEYSYVIFAKKRVHEYSYPNLESLQKPPTKRDSINSLKKHASLCITSQPALPTKSKKKEKRRGSSSAGPVIGLSGLSPASVSSSDPRLSSAGRLVGLGAQTHCKYCHELFSPSENPRGACEYAPDQVGNCIEKVTCLFCAEGIIYHCVSDPEGDYGHLCVCDSSDDSNCRKWTALSVLSFFLPCLWCYWPLKTCHRCGISCGCCGGRHKAS